MMYVRYRHGGSISTLETLNFYDIDPTVAEMEAFNGLVEEIESSVPPELKEQLAQESFAAKFGGPADTSNGFGKA